MKNVLLLAFVFQTLLIVAQNETNHWYFGTYVSLDFTTGIPVVGSSPMTTSEGTASISDSNGNLLFYTNGVDVYNASHSVMPNGSNLKGDVSTTQSALIVPSPSNTNQFYIFTLAPDGGANGFCYSVADMTLDGGNGDITGVKNVPVTDSVCEKIAAIKIPSENEYWIVIHKYGTNEFYSYLLDASGMQSPVISTVGTIHNTTTFQNTYGQMKFNACGDKIALALGYMNQVEMYDFNIQTGVVSNPVYLPMPDHVYGVEFSENSDYLYVTCYDDTKALIQFDISSGNESLIQASESPVSATDNLYGLQLGPDGKIYVSRSFSSNFLGVINSPELAGFACNYVDNAIDLDPNFMGSNGALSLPSFMQSFLSSDTDCPKSVDIDEFVNENIFSVEYNFGNEEFIVSLRETGRASISVYEISGKLVDQIEFTSNCNFGINYTPGIYILRVQQGNKSEVFKLSK